MSGIEIKRPRYECPRHGEHNYTLEVKIEDVLSRRYCMRCLIEHLDKLKINEMEEIRGR